MTILETRGAPLNEAQLWAVCNVAATYLHRHIYGETDGTTPPGSMSCGAGASGSGGECAGGGSVLVSPKAMHLGADGSVAFTPTTDPGEVDQFLPEGFEEWPSADKLTQERGHTFSLAATLYAAADYGLPVDEEPKISEDMELVLSSMTDDNVSERLDLEYVIDLTNDALLVSPPQMQTPRGLGVSKWCQKS